jgi:hypothetical protein
LLEPVGGRLVIHGQDARCERRQVRFDRRLVLARRRDDLCRADQPALVQLVAVEQQAARRLGGPRRDAGPRDPWLACTLGRTLAVDEVDRGGDGMDEFDGAGGDAPVRIPGDRRGQADPREGRARQGVESIAGQRDAS